MPTASASRSARRAPVVRPPRKLGQADHLRRAESGRRRVGHDQDLVRIERGAPQGRDRNQPDGHAVRSENAGEARLVVAFAVNGRRLPDNGRLHGPRLGRGRISGQPLRQNTAQLLCHAGEYPGGRRWTLVHADRDQNLPGRRLQRGRHDSGLPRARPGFLAVRTVGCQQELPQIGIPELDGPRRTPGHNQAVVHRDAAIEIAQRNELVAQLLDPVDRLLQEAEVEEAVDEGRRHAIADDQHGAGILDQCGR